MTSKKPKPLPSRHPGVRRRPSILKPELSVMEAQIVSVGRDAVSDATLDDHLVLWKRKVLFVTWPAELLGSVPGRGVGAGHR